MPLTPRAVTPGVRAGTSPMMRAAQYIAFGMPTERRLVAPLVVDEGRGARAGSEASLEARAVARFFFRSLSGRLLGVYE